MKYVVGIGEMAVSGRPGDILVTYSLGSCLGVAVVDVVARVGGLIHCQLPQAKLDEEKSRRRPAMFVDSGVPLLLRRLEECGAERSRLVIKVAGGAKIMDAGNVFRIGERNVTALRKVLWKENLLIKAKDIGGEQPRTLSLEVGTGSVAIQSGVKQWQI